MNLEQTIVNGRPVGDIINPDFEDKKLLIRALHKYHLYKFSNAMDKLYEIDFVKKYKRNTIATYLNCVKYYILNGHAPKRTCFSSRNYEYIQQLLDKHVTPLRPAEAERDLRFFRATPRNEKSAPQKPAEKPTDSLLKIDFTNRTPAQPIAEEIRKTAESAEKIIEKKCACEKDKLDKVITILELLCRLTEK